MINNPWILQSNLLNWKLQTQRAFAQKLYSTMIWFKLKKVPISAKACSYNLIKIKRLKTEIKLLVKHKYPANIIV